MATLSRAFLCVLWLVGAPGVHATEAEPASVSLKQSYYTTAWTYRGGKITDIAIDHGGQLWALDLEPSPTMVRLDPQGKPAQFVTLQPGSGRPNSYYQRAELSVLKDGSFVIKDERYQANGDYMQTYEVGGSSTRGPQDELYFTRFDGVRRVDPDSGEITQTMLGRGIKPGRFTKPGAVAVSENKLIVVDGSNLHEFAPDGSVRTKHKTPWRENIDADLGRSGGLWLATNNGVHGYDTQLNHRVHLSDDVVLRIAPAANDTLITLDRYNTIRAHQPINGGLFAAPRGETLSRYEHTPAIHSIGSQSLVVRWRKHKPLGLKLHADPTHIWDIATDPTDADTLWLGTNSGLVRLNTQSGGLLQVTRAHGLPAATAGRLWLSADDEYVWIANKGIVRVKKSSPQQHIESFSTPTSSTRYRGDFLGKSADGLAMWFWDRNGLYRVAGEDSEAEHFQFEFTLRGAAAITQLEGGFFLHDANALWRFNAKRKELQRVLVTDDLTAAIEATSADRVEMGALQMDDRVLWIGSQRHGVFAYDMSSESISAIASDGQTLAACSSNKQTHSEVIKSSATRYIKLGRCLLRRDGTNNTLLHKTPPHTQLDVVRGDRLGGAWLVSAAQLIHASPTGANTPYKALPMLGPKGQTRSMLVAQDQLWLGTSLSLSGFDLVNGGWQVLPEIKGIRKLRIATGRKRPGIMAIAHAKYWWVDSETLNVESINLVREDVQFGDRVIQDAVDFDFDGRQFWVVRGKGRVHGANKGLYRLAAGTSEHWRFASDIELGELTSVHQDPNNAQRIWVTTRSGQLIDLNKDTRNSMLIGSLQRSKTTLTQAQSTFMENALASPQIRALTLKPNETLDPENPQHIWRISTKGLEQVDVQSNTRLAWLDLPLSAGAIAVSGKGSEKRIWAATNDGVWEIPAPSAALPVRQVAPL